MVLIANHTFNTMNSQQNDSSYTDQGPYASDLYGINGSADFMPEPYTYTRMMDDAAFTTTAGFGAGSSYAEAPHYFVSNTSSPGTYNHLDSPELRAPASNLSTASGPSVASAASSTIGSPYSAHTHGVPIPEWGNPGHSIGPSIVQYDSFGHEYSNVSGMEQDFVLADFTKPGFVGECSNISSTPRASSQSMKFPFSLHPQAQSTAMTIDTFVQDISSLNGSSAPSSALSNANADFLSNSLLSPLSSYTHSPSSVGHTFQTFPFSDRSGASDDSNADLRRLQWSVSPTQHSNSKQSSNNSSVNSSRRSPFFSQSSGHFVAPLQSSCRFFPLSFYQHGN